MGVVLERRTCQTINKFSTTKRDGDGEGNGNGNPVPTYYSVNKSTTTELRFLQELHFFFLLLITTLKKCTRT